LNIQVIPFLEVDMLNFMGGGSRAAMPPTAGLEERGVGLGVDSCIYDS